MVRAIADGPSGETFWLPRVRPSSSSRHRSLGNSMQLVYIKAHAYRVHPLKNHGNLSIDGEAKPFEDFQVEVHPKLATLLSLYGYYKADFPGNELQTSEEC